MSMRGNLSIGIVTGSMSRQAGGLFNSVRKSALNLADAGAEISVYALRDMHSESDRTAWAPIEPRLFDAELSSKLGYSRRLGPALKQAGHDVVHLHGIWQLISRSVQQWKQATARPVMISPRGMLDPWALRNSGWKKRLAGLAFENANLRSADCLHALNQSEAGAIRSCGLSNPIAIIPNGADLPDLEEAPSSGKRKKLLFLGRIHPKKGLAELLHAWGSAIKSSPELRSNWQLVIAGWDDGGHLGSLCRLSAELGLTQDVEFAGPVFGEKKDRLLRSVEGFILPSHSEGLPMSVLEAWAYRLPVFMTCHCNLPEGFESGAAIEISTNPEQIAPMLEQHLMRRDLEQFGSAGRQLVEREFSWSRIAAEHMRVYEWLCGRGQRPDCVTVD